MLASGTVLQNRYSIIRQLGVGGMGTVYEAMDLRFDHQVALKETHFTEAALRKQFEREARLLYKLRHPALARVIDHFTEGEGQYLVMDFVEGDELWARLQQRGAALPVEDVLRWGDQLLDALQYLHSQDPPVIHRDIKPQNLKVSNTGQIILLDFGLAKGFAGQISRVTTSGSIFGYTPNYAPLEQIQGTGTDPRSDLYSLAATLYHLMTGLVPPDALSRATAIMSEQPDPLRPAYDLNSLVPVAVANVLQNAMSQNPNRRPAMAAAMRENLRQAKNTPASLQSSDMTGAGYLPPTVVSPVKSSEQPYEPFPTIASPSLERTPQAQAAWPVSGPTQPSQFIATSQASTLVEEGPPRRKPKLYVYVLAVLLAGIFDYLLYGTAHKIPYYLYIWSVFDNSSDFTRFLFTFTLPYFFTFAILGGIFSYIWPQMRRRWWALFTITSLAAFSVMLPYRYGWSSTSLRFFIEVPTLISSGAFVGVQLTRRDMSNRRRLLWISGTFIWLVVVTMLMIWIFRTIYGY